MGAGEAKRVRFLEAALASVADGVIVVDAAERLVFANEAGHRLIPRTPTPELRAADLQLRYPDGRPMPPGETPLGRALRGEVVSDFPIGVDGPDGAGAHLSSGASPVRNGRGDILGAVVLFHEVIESSRREKGRKRLLGRLREANQALVLAGTREQELAERAQRRAAELLGVLDNMVEGVFVCDAGGHITLANEPGVRLLGFHCLEEIEDSIVELHRRLQMCHPDGRPYAEEELPLVRALSGETVVLDKAVFRNPLTQEDVFVSTNAAPIRDERREIVGAVAVTRDMTDLAELDHLKDQFIAVAAHELKTPVTIMKGFAQLLLRTAEDLTPDCRRMLDALDEGAGRMDRIVKDLLDISRLQLSHLDLDPETIDLQQLVEQAVERTVLVADRHRLRVVRGKPAVVQGDRRRLEQVLANLIDNALRYSPEGGDVQVEAELRDGRAIVAVRDQGIGIPADKQAGIFQRFYRAHAETPCDYSGMGVGLYISREIISRHDGRMWFDSEEGNGSTFYFSLPLKAEPAGR